MTPELKAAIYQWLSGLVIGFVPIFMHGIHYLVWTPTPNWDDKWSTDIIFIVIINSGLSGVMGFNRIIRIALRDIVADAKAGVLMALSILILLVSGVLYSVSASGPDNFRIVLLSIGFLIASIIISVYFEIALAKRAVPATP